ncbi:3'(2'),5'-bisphosphate nucleotidase CysQ [Stappia sp. ES.058]|uniref:3'(2'),5'-bisphosphate nucleotidase CysQ n=1 Tax=Stappia sp. ES.058 TaxID=1881061 RepID=UPI00087DF496|nr:3'(2'),5'-bisphosphate nucleotidase CysQ [Stappia sp. ES.058]SDU02345.1 3'(2'),5'-bisphosphate nucleotidase [Stappia sp. ES.058]
MPIGEELHALAGLCDDAGDLILTYFCDGVRVDRKADDSPVTEADRRAEDVILSGLARLYPNIPVVAEEAASGGRVPEISDRFFLVDPLDGTREFVSGRGDFTVNIALVENGQPVLGAVFAPHRGTAFVGNVGTGAFERMSQAQAGSQWRKIAVRSRAPANPIAVASRSHRDAKTDDLLDRLAMDERVSVGSSLKFCLLARGDADFYPRFGRTMEWDTAAGHAVLVAAGGRVAGLDGGPFLYGKRNQSFDSDFANPGFLAAGDDNLIARAAALNLATNGSDTTI